MLRAKVVSVDSNKLVTLQDEKGDTVSGVTVEQVMSAVNNGNLEIVNMELLKEEHSSLSEMKKLVSRLNEARRVYEQGTDEIMSNREYDELYDKLLEMEKETGVVLSDSPTINVGYEVVSGLPKVAHETPMKSLGKTKDVEEIKEFVGDREVVGSIKLDGLTVVATFENGELRQAVTRGNGEIGELITANAKQFIGLPRVIPYKGKLVVRGEALIDYATFERVSTDGEYKNPRNLCSGTVRQLNSRVVADRGVRFVAFNLVSIEGVELKTVMNRLKYLDDIGFETVKRVVTSRNNIESAMRKLEGYVEETGYPADGLVFTYNDVAYGESLGDTAKYPKHSIAFKWQDECAETTIVGMDWDVSRYGTLTPVAVFNPVELEGTTVTRASVHNLNIMAELALGYGDRVKVYKANMIIPQIAENLTKSGTCVVPSTCPFCGGATEICEETNSGTLTLKCVSGMCGRQDIQKLTHFVSRDAMNIVGLSEKKLLMLVETGFISDAASIYKLKDSIADIAGLEGFGMTSAVNLVQAVENSKDVKLYNFIYALGIPNVGLQTSKVICDYFDNDIVKLFGASYSQLCSIASVGDIIASSVYEYISNMDNVKKAAEIARNLRFIKEAPKTNEMSGLVFCVTGAVEIFNNRKEIQQVIESKGGKLTGSVSASTSYLITNDTTSGSAKNKAAQQYGIPILTEREFIDKFNIM